jgi:hypothetical protein
MATAKLPFAVRIAAVMMLLVAVFYFYGAVSAILAGNEMLGSGSEVERGFGQILRVIGVVDAIVGFLFLVVGIGVLRRWQWVVPLGIQVSLIGTLVGVLGMNPLLIASSVVLYLYLRRPSTRDEFDRMSYERPTMPADRARAVVTGAPASASRYVEDRASPRRPEGPSVPGGFMRCPQCDTLNPEGKKHCRMCAVKLT